MLNIEVIKFEAQDVITASGDKKPAANEQQKPAPVACTCGIAVPANPAHAACLADVHTGQYCADARVQH